MKYLILGVNGMAGHMIANYLKNKEHIVIGFARQKSPLVECVIGDVRDLALLKKTVLSGNYDVIVNCIGILNQFAEERKADAVFLNSYLPHYLAFLTEPLKTRIIHISTDCVFSGDVGGYNEASFRDGKTFYDRSKALGELEDGKNITLRNSIIGPDLNENGIGLLNWFMKQSGTIKGYKNAIWNGITTLQLAKIIESISRTKCSGLFNMVPNESISKFELLRFFNKYFKNNNLEIIPDSSVVVNKTLKRTNYSFNNKIPNYSVMIQELAEWIKNYDYLYPSYYKAE